MYDDDADEADREARRRARWELEDAIDRIGRTQSTASAVHSSAIAHVGHVAATVSGSAVGVDKVMIGTALELTARLGAVESYLAELRSRTDGEIARL